MTDLVENDSLDYGKIIEFQGFFFTQSGSCCLKVDSEYSKQLPEKKLFENSEERDFFFSAVIQSNTVQESSRVHRFQVSLRILGIYPNKILQPERF